MFEMLDPSYLEADAYGLFAKLMARMETYYRIRNVVPNASGELPRAIVASDVKMTVTVGLLRLHSKYLSVLKFNVFR